MHHILSHAIVMIMIRRGHGVAMTAKIKRSVNVVCSTRAKPFVASSAFDYFTFPANHAIVHEIPHVRVF